MRKETRKLGEMAILREQKFVGSGMPKRRNGIFGGGYYFCAIGSVNPTDYLKKLRKRDTILGSYIGTNCPQVEMATETGKNRRTLAASPEQLFRIIQSIPSPKAEPIKL